MATRLASDSRTLNRRETVIALVGHSFQDQAMTIGTPPNRIVQTETRGIATWLSILTGGQYVIAEDCKFGVSGATSANVLATPISGGGTQVSRAIACRASVIYLHIGTNDVTSGRTLAAIIADVTSIIAQLADAGKIVVLSTGTARGTATYTAARYTTAQVRVALGYRDWVLRAAPAIRPGRVIVADEYAATVDPNPAVEGDVLAGATQDGVHPSAYGAWLITSRALVPAMAVLDMPRRPPAIHMPGDIYNATDNPRGNILGVAGGMLGSNAQTGTSGAITLAGVRPNGWLNASGNGAAQASSLTVTGSQVTGTPTGRWYQTVITGTTLANAAPVIQLQSNVSVPDTLVASGDTVQLFGEIEIASGSVGLVGVGGGLFRQWASGFDNYRTFLNETVSPAAKLDQIVASANLGYQFDGEPRVLWDANATTLLAGMVLIQLAPSTTINATILTRNMAIRKVL
jgi:lysophospholipase L1-like esterase